MNKTEWFNNACIVCAEYDAYVDWGARFYECPYCGELIYECDWKEEELKSHICPVCENNY